MILMPYFLFMTSWAAIIFFLVLPHFSFQYSNNPQLYSIYLLIRALTIPILIILLVIVIVNRFSKPRGILYSIFRKSPFLLVFIALFGAASALALVMNPVVATAYALYGISLSFVYDTSKFSFSLTRAFRKLRGRK
jgi:hypothetical protein